MADLVLSVPSISCAHCKATIERAVQEVGGIKRVQVDVDRKTVEVDFQDAPRIEPVIRAIERTHKVAGYSI